MAWTLGLLGAALEVASGSYEFLETTTLTSDTSSISFSNLNSTYGSTYQHLQLRIIARTNRTGADSDPLLLTFNDTGGSSYSRHGLMAYLNTSVVSQNASSTNGIYLSDAIATNQNASGIFAGVVVDIYDAFETTKHKTLKAFAGMYASGWQSVELRSGAFYSSSAITKITLNPVVGSNFVSGTRASLYGIRSA
jgi:hypothetical protein